ncbi:MAG: hypothetical protein ACTSRP_17220 [Candidatus Helarchaeota archaeon]
MFWISNNRTAKLLLFVIILSVNGLSLGPVWLCYFMDSYYYSLFNNKATENLIDRTMLKPILDKCRDALFQELLPEGYYYQGDQVYCTSHVLRPLNLIRTFYHDPYFSELDLMKKCIENHRQHNLFWRCNEFIATDIDTTLQALSALVGLVNYTYIYESLDNLSELQLEDGSFKTWIDAENYTYEDLHTDPDCIQYDEIGVLLYYTYIINNTRYSDMLHKGAEYLSSKQNRNGTWETPWYVGDYFGVFKIGSFLAMLNKTKYQKQLQLCYSFVMNTMNSDYGWGRNGISNPLDTAYCLTFLIHYTNNLNLIQKSLKYLIKTQESSGLWHSVPFFRVFYEPEDLIFESEIFTSGIVLETFAIYLQYLYSHN